MKHLVGFVFLAIALLCCTAFAEPMALPKGLVIIDEEAFCGDESLSEIIVPEGCLFIEDRAFADSALTTISLPSSLLFIADDAIPEKVTVMAAEDSYAYDWAVENGYALISGGQGPVPHAEDLVGGASSAEMEYIVSISADRTEAACSELFYLKWNAGWAENAVLWRRTKYGIPARTSKTSWAKRAKSRIWS